MPRVVKSRSVDARDQVPVGAAVAQRKENEDQKEESEEIFPRNLTEAEGLAIVLHVLQGKPGDPPIEPTGPRPILFPSSRPNADSKCQLTPVRNSPASKAYLMREIQYELRTRVQSWNYGTFLHASRHGEFLQINHSKGQTRCIRALNRTLSDRGPRWVYSTLTYGPWMKTVITTLAENELFTFCCMNCNHKCRGSNMFRCFFKMPVTDFKSVMARLQIDKEDLNIVKPMMQDEVVRLKPETIDRLEKVCKEFLGL